MDRGACMKVIPLVVMVSEEVFDVIFENRGTFDVPTMASNILFQASRDRMMLNRARDMVENQPWTGYDNTTYE